MRVEIIEQFGQEIEFVFLDNINGSYTSILKSVYDAQQEQLTENPTEDE